GWVEWALCRCNHNTSCRGPISERRVGYFFERRPAVCSPFPVASVRVALYRCNHNTSCHGPISERHVGYFFERRPAVCSPFEGFDLGLKLAQLQKLPCQWRAWQNARRFWNS